MSVLKFDLDENNRLVLTPELMMFRAFRDVIENDVNPDKRAALDDLRWCKFMFEEEGAFSKYEGAEKLHNINLEVYDTVTPVFSPQRTELRQKAGEFFRDVEETIEGGMLAMLQGRMRVIRKVMDQTEKKALELVPSELDNFMAQTTAQASALTSLLKQINEVQKEIEKKGGKQKVRNIADAISTPNETGVFTYEKMKARREAKAANEAAQ